MREADKPYALSSKALQDALARLPKADEDAPEIIQIAVFSPARTVGSVETVQMYTLTFDTTCFSVDQHHWWDWVLNKRDLI